jgi:chromosome segregation ATPase
VIGLERRQAEDECVALDARSSEAQQKIAGLEEEQRGADQCLADAQRSLGGARAAAAELNDKAASARAAHAGLVERATALNADVVRLREAALELEERITSRSEERRQTASRREELLHVIAAGERMLDDDIRELDRLRDELRTADEAASALRAAVDAQDSTIREARQLLEGVRSEVASFDVARATAEADLAHLAQSCADAVQMSLDTVLADVEAMEQAGTAVPDAVAIASEEPESDEDSGSAIGDPGSAIGEPVNSKLRIPHPDPGFPRLQVSMDRRRGDRRSERKNRSSGSCQHDGGSSNSTNWKPVTHF